MAHGQHMVHIRPQFCHHRSWSIRLKVAARVINSTVGVCVKCCSEQVTACCMSVSVVNHQPGASFGVSRDGNHWASLWQRRYGRDVMDCYSWSLNLVCSDFHIFDPLRSSWLAGDWQQMLTWSKLSAPGYRNVTQIFSMQPLVSWWSKCQWWLHGSLDVCLPLPLFHVFIKARISILASECSLSYFTKLLCIFCLSELKEVVTKLIEALHAVFMTGFLFQVS